MKHYTSETPQPKYFVDKPDFQEPTEAQEPSEKQELPPLPSQQEIDLAIFSTDPESESSIFAASGRPHNQETFSTLECLSPDEFTSPNTEYLDSLGVEEWLGSHLTSKTYNMCRAAKETVESPHARSEIPYAHRSLQTLRDDRFMEESQRLPSLVHMVDELHRIPSTSPLRYNDLECSNTQAIKVHDHDSPSGLSRSFTHVRDIDLQDRCLSNTQRRRRSVHFSKPITGSNGEGKGVRARSSLTLDLALSSSPTFAKAKHRANPCHNRVSSNIRNMSAVPSRNTKPCPRVPFHKDSVEAGRRTHAAATRLSINDHCEALVTLMGDLENRYKGRIDEDFDARMDGVKRQLKGLIECLGSLREAR